MPATAQIAWRTTPERRERLAAHLRRTGRSLAGWLNETVDERLDREAPLDASLLLDAIVAMAGVDPSDPLPLTVNLQYDGTIDASFADDRTQRLSDLATVRGRPDGRGNIAIDLVGLPGTPEDGIALPLVALPAGCDMTVTLRLVDRDPALSEPLEVVSA